MSNATPKRLTPAEDAERLERIKSRYVSGYLLKDDDVSWLIQMASDYIAVMPELVRGRLG